MTTPTATSQDDRASSGTRPKQRGGRWPIRDYPSIMWVVLAGIIAIAHRWVPESTWLMIHLVLLGALTHAILVWSTYFTQALLKTPESIDSRKQQSRRLVLLLVGVAAVLIGVPSTVWPLTVAGATLASTAVIWHGVALWRRLRHALPGRFRISIRYYLFAALMVPIGATLGATLAKGLSDEWHGRYLLAHSVVMLLGWVGLTVTGTLVTFWPTMLRTRIDDRAETLAKQALPILLVGVVGAATAALLGSRIGAVAGLLVYAVGLLWWGRSLLRPFRQAPPRQFSTWSASAGLVWLYVFVGWLIVHVATADDWSVVAVGYSWLAAVGAVGFALQLLFGATSYLLPTTVSAGPAAVRASQACYDQFTVLRVTVVNVGLVLWLLPLSSAIRVVISAIVLVALISFVPLSAKGIKVGVASRKAAAQAMVAAKKAREEAEESGASADEAAAAARAASEEIAPTTRPGPRDHTPQRPNVWSAAQLVGGLAVIAIGLTLGVAADPAAAGLDVGTTSGGITGTVAAGAEAQGTNAVTPTGETTTITVTAKDMRFHPASVTVPRGNRLVIELVNEDDSSPHDLAFSASLKTKRIMPGERTTLDVGVVGQTTQGWCTIIGHRRMGMVFDVIVTGGEQAVSKPGETGPAAPGAAVATQPPLDLQQEPGPDFRPHDAVLPPLTDEKVHRLTLTADEIELEVAPGIKQRRWVYNGSAPGPTLHGRVGDVFEITFVNNGTMGHSLDFHASHLAPDKPMRTIPPGESLVYRFTAQRSGIWMYHCGTMPMTDHIAAGLHGVVIIEPEGLPEVDRSYVLVQSEVYVDGDGKTEIKDLDSAAVAAEKPDAVVFNGIANQYDHRPLTAKVGERVRFWVLDAGPNRPTSFHIIGGQYDTVYSEGTYLLKNGRGPLDPPDMTTGGSQALGLQPAQGGFVELVFPEAGHYPFVSHVMVDGERGAHGIVEVTQP